MVNVVSSLSTKRDQLLIDLPGVARFEAADDEQLTPVNFFDRRVAAVIQRSSEVAFFHKLFEPYEIAIILPKFL